MPIITHHHENNRECYILDFNGIRLGFIDCLDLQNLKHFSLPVQQRLGKTDIRFNIDFLRNTPHIHSLNYVLMTEYKQIITMPYLLRNQKCSTKIVTTKSMYQSAKIYAMDFYFSLKKVDQVVSTLSFEEDSIIADKYEQEFSQVDFSSWPKLYAKKELLHCFQNCVQLNYGERYDTGNGVILSPYASGEQIGSACWLMEAKLTKQSLLWVQDMSHHEWRACRQMELCSNFIGYRHQNLRKIDTIVFAKQSLTNIEDVQCGSSDELECINYLQGVLHRLNKGSPATIVVKDILVICDIINYIAYHFKDKFKGIVITGFSGSKMMSYANSLVEYLHTSHRNRIYEDPPAYPFQTYQDLRHKNFIMEGTLQEIASVKKIPIKELMLRILPHLHFISDFYAYVQGSDGHRESDMHEECSEHDPYLSSAQDIFISKVSIQKIQTWVSSIQNSRVVCFCDQNENSQKLQAFKRMFEDKLTLLPVQDHEKDIYYDTSNKQLHKYYTIEGSRPAIHQVSKYHRMNEWLILEPFSYADHCLLLPKDWLHLLTMQVQQQCNTQQTNQISMTDNQLNICNRTIVTLDNYRLQIESNSEEDLVMLSHILRTLTLSLH